MYLVVLALFVPGLLLTGMVGSPKPGERAAPAEPSRDRVHAFARFGSPYGMEPKNGRSLRENGDIALFAGETDEDATFNATNRTRECRNSLFAWRWAADGGRNWLIRAGPESCAIGSTTSNWRAGSGRLRACT